MEELPRTPSHRRLWAAAFAAFTILRVLGTAFVPALLAFAPIVLVIASPFLAHLVLVAPLVSPGVYFPVAIAVSIIHCWVGYAFGRVFGEAAVTWIEAHTPVKGRRMAFILRLLDRSTPLVLFAFPGPIPATLAGVGGVRPLKFYPLMVTAQIVWVAACHFLGATLLDTIETLRAHVTDHAVVLTMLFCLVVFGRRLFLRRSGPSDGA